MAKTLFFIAVVLAVLVVSYVQASGPIKTMCPICKDEITNGTYTAGMMIKGKVAQVHFEHAFNYAFKQRFAPLAKKK